MTKTLPKEIASLIHHITLNEQGWWDKTIQRLIISAFIVSGFSSLFITTISLLIKGKKYDLQNA